MVMLRRPPPDRQALKPSRGGGPLKNLPGSRQAPRALDLDPAQTENAQKQLSARAGGRALRPTDWTPSQRPRARAVFSGAERCLRPPLDAPSDAHGVCLRRGATRHVLRANAPFSKGASPWGAGTFAWALGGCAASRGSQ